jgi:hypothetical protein
MLINIRLNVCRENNPRVWRGSSAVRVSRSVEIASAGAQLLARQPATEKYFAMQ